MDSCYGDVIGKRICINHIANKSKGHVSMTHAMGAFRNLGLPSYPSTYNKHRREKGTKGSLHNYIYIIESSLIHKLLHPTTPLV